MWIYKIVALVFALHLTASAQEECPSIYRRFSRQHSACLPRSTRCDFLDIGIRDQYAEKMVILNTHNQLRSKVAMGQESRAGGLPTASNMLELEWDEELAYIAQKWAEQCIFEHECWPCRASRSYAVGQNLAELTYSCQDQCEVMEHDWKTMITAWYDEVRDFKKSLIPSIKFDPIYGHFVTMTWAETYRIGCGYASYRVGRSAAKQLYVCDYAPAAIREKRMYKEGSPCSDCPLNSCCGSTCHDPENHAGLCRLSSTPPILPPKQTRLFYCSFQERDPNCLFYPEGPTTWEFVRTVDGILLSTVVEQQQSAVANFQQWIYARNGSCLRLNIRKGPNVEGELDASILKLEFERQNGNRAMQLFPRPPWQFVKSSLPMFFDGYFKLIIKMSVPAGAPPQFLEMKEIELDSEPCMSSAHAGCKIIYHLTRLLILIHMFRLCNLNSVY